MPPPEARPRLSTRIRVIFDPTYFEINYKEFTEYAIEYPYADLRDYILDCLKEDTDSSFDGISVSEVGEVA